MSTAYEVVWFRGHRFDRMTVQALLEMEKRLGYQLTVLQGSYNGTSVEQSAGTHAGGGAVDLAPLHADQKVHVGRDVGFAMWHRHTWQGDWVEHVHGILVGNLKAAPSALRQVAQYRNRTNGLSDFGPDTEKYRPAVIKPYTYRIEPSIAVDVSNVQIDFINALHGQSNLPHRRVKIIQRRLNSKSKGKRSALVVDGVVGEVTLNRWGWWEEACGVKDANRIPDMPRLSRLLKGSIYYAVP